MTAEPPSHGPIYIGGLERSGKTYLRLMLSPHPDLFFSKRTNLWSRHYGRYGDLRVAANLDRCLAALMSSKHIRALQPDLDRLRRELGQGPATYERLFAQLHAHQAQRLGKSRWGDQTEGVEAYTDLILAAYPGARVIHMIRDPRDRYEAIRARGRGGRDSGLKRSTARWVCSAQLACDYASDYPDRYRVVRYETLVTQPAETLRDLCDFLGLTMTPDMLALGHAPRFTTRDGAGPLKTVFVGRYRDHLPTWAIDTIQARAAKLMTFFDYEPEPVRLSWLDRARGRAALAFA